MAEAARVNAVMSDAAASDDSDLRNIVHAGTTLVATSLAMAERTGASGQDVLAAIAGYEASGRIGEAVTPACVPGAFTAASCRSLPARSPPGGYWGFDPSRMAQAIALSATSIGGPMAAANTSVAREYHAGLAAMLGCTPRSRRRRGIWRKRASSKHAMASLKSTAAHGAGVTRDLGRAWDIITDMAIKLVPGGHPSHALAEAAANAARAGNVSPDEVETITLSRPGVTALSGPVHPTDLIGMAHSPAYFLAAGVADHDFMGARHRGQDHGSGHPAAPRQGPRRRATHRKYRAVQAGRDVTIRTKDGRTFSNTVYAPKGAGVRGIDWADVDAKYHTLVPRAQLSDRQVEQPASHPRLPPCHARPILD